MSATKQLKKAVQTMTDASLAAEHGRLSELYVREKNGMRRASLKERIRICDAEHQRRYLANLPI